MCYCFCSKPQSSLECKGGSDSHTSFATRATERQKPQRFSAIPDKKKQTIHKEEIELQLYLPIISSDHFTTVFRSALLKKQKRKSQ
jgi:hypothetical protein